VKNPAHSLYILEAVNEKDKIIKKAKIGCENFIVSKGLKLNILLTENIKKLNRGE
jgi:hypothetical protein